MEGEEKALSVFPAEGSGGLTWTQTLGKLFRPGDIIVTETGTSGKDIECSKTRPVDSVLKITTAFGSAASRLPKGAVMYNQTIFGSIGYAGPSAAGAFQAAKENGHLGRGILITGEGSLQLTPMCFADMLKLELKPIVYAQIKRLFALIPSLLGCCQF